MVAEVMGVTGARGRGLRRSEAEAMLTSYCDESRCESRRVSRNDLLNPRPSVGLCMKSTSVINTGS